MKIIYIYILKSTPNEDSLGTFNENVFVQNSNGFIEMDKFINVAYYSLCSISYQKDGKEYNGTGFFIKLPIPSKENPIYGLMTNNHILNKSILSPNSSFNIYFEKLEKSYTIELNNAMFVWTSELIDITFIQLTSDFINKNKEMDININFLEPCYEDHKTDHLFYLIQYPEGKNKLYISNGSIKSINGINYFHTASAKSGSSGSPLLNSKLEVIGVHKGGIEYNNSRSDNNINVATKFTIVENAIRIIYNRKYLIKNNENSLLSVKELSPVEKENLFLHGLEETLSTNVFKYSINSIIPTLLFYRENHSWYWSFDTEKLKNKNYDIKELKRCEWSLIDSTINNLSDFKLKHIQKVTISWLEMTKLEYLL